MQGSARKDGVFGAARVYTFTVPGPKWKSWFRALQGLQEFQRFVDRSHLKNLDKRVRSSSPVDQSFLVPVLCAYDEKNCSIALSHGLLPPKRIVVSPSLLEQRGKAGFPQG